MYAQFIVQCAHCIVHYSRNHFLNLFLYFFVLSLDLVIIRY